MDTWKKIFHDGFVPQFSTETLISLRDALANDDKRLIQGATTMPPPLACVRDFDCEAACLVGFCGWQNAPNGTVDEVEEQFARFCYEADQRLGEPGACRYLLNAWDDRPRDEIRKALLVEVELALSQRATAAA